MFTLCTSNILTSEQHKTFRAHRRRIKLKYCLNKINNYNPAVYTSTVLIILVQLKNFNSP